MHYYTHLIIDSLSAIYNLSLPACFSCIMASGALTRECDDPLFFMES